MFHTEGIGHHVSCGMMSQGCNHVADCRFHTGNWGYIGKIRKPNICLEISWSSRLGVVAKTKQIEWCLCGPIPGLSLHFVWFLPLYDLLKIVSFVEFIAEIMNCVFQFIMAILSGEQNKKFKIGTCQRKLSKNAISVWKSCPGSKWSHKA